MITGPIDRLVAAARAWAECRRARGLRGDIGVPVEIEKHLVQAVDALPPDRPRRPGARFLGGFILTRDDLGILLQLPEGHKIVEIRPPAAWAHPDCGCTIIVEGESMPETTPGMSVFLSKPDRIRMDTRKGFLQGVLWFGMVLVGPLIQTENQKPDGGA